MNCEIHSGRTLSGIGAPSDTLAGRGFWKETQAGAPDRAREPQAPGQLPWPGGQVHGGRLGSQSSCLRPMAHPQQAGERAMSFPTHPSYSVSGHAANTQKTDSSWRRFSPNVLENPRTSHPCPLQMVGLDPTGGRQHEVGLSAVHVLGEGKQGGQSLEKWSPR